MKNMNDKNIGSYIIQCNSKTAFLLACSVQNRHYFAHLSPYYGNDP